MVISPTSIEAGKSNAHMIYIPVGVFGILCPVLVCARIWSRLTKQGQMGADDYTIIAALAFCLMSSAVMVTACQYGFGHHSDTIDASDNREVLKYFYLCQISYKISINLTKCSILLLYLRISHQIRWFRWSCWTLIIVTGSYCFATVIATIFQCSPVEKAYDKELDGTCINNAGFWYANAGFSIASDVIILLIPMPLIYRLQIPRVQKIALVIVFALGGCVVITSCLRVTTIDIATHSSDVTYDIASTMWSLIEPNVAVICACLPMIRPLIVKVFPKFMSNKSSGQNNVYTGHAYGLRSRTTPYTRSKEGEWIELDAGKTVGNTASVHAGVSPDNDSEENILAEGERRGVGRPGSRMDIQKTVRYDVERSKS